VGDNGRQGIKGMDLYGSVVGRLTKGCGCGWINRKRSAAVGNVAGEGNGQLVFTVLVCCCFCCFVRKRNRKSCVILDFE